MHKSLNLLLNTSSLYIKITITAITTLLSTRIAIHALGVENFGLYNLIAGILVILSFLNSSLMVSSQRFLSFTIGENNNKKLKKIFNTSLLIHLLIGLLFLVFCKLIESFFFDGFLDIPFGMHDVAIRIYNLIIISSIINLITIPYSASINAREEMWAFSLSEILVAVMKLGTAYSLLYIKGDLLYIYTLGIMISIFTGALTKIFWCNYRYKECRINIKEINDTSLIKEMLRFTGWNTLVSLASVTRNQGVNILLNTFFGTVINAAYAIANQVNSLVMTFATSITTVFSPLIIKTKGEDKNEKMISLSIFSSKLSFLTSSLIALPLLLYTDEILLVWLEEVPAYSASFCKLIICVYLIMQLYPGITRGLYAEGNIKWYQIIVSFILISILPIGYCILKQGFSPLSILYGMLIMQFATLLATVYSAHKRIKLNYKKFLINSVFYPILTYGFVYTSSLFINNYFLDIKSIIYIISFSVLIMSLYTLLFYNFIFTIYEKETIKNLFQLIHEKINFKNNK